MKTYTSGPDRQRLARMVTLAVGIGNLDLHSKNLGLIHPKDGDITLAPAYDVVPQAHMPGDGRLALAVNGKYRHADITRDDLNAEFTAWGLRGASSTVAETLEELHTVVCEEPPMDGAFPHLQEQLHVFIDNLRNGRPVGPTSGGVGR